ncbi:MAG: fluoride efflux transporter CrcB [Verrucomicrobiota bacterium]|nr:fluoride efflux transporter CrcB [Verrucomicrobiota bacterium]
MLNYILVGLGGAIGSVLRFWLSGVFARGVGETFPFGTLFVNVSGSFLIGIFAAASDPDGRWLLNPSARVFFMIGLCGGYTTFSSFSLQTLALLQEGEWLRAGANVLGSVVLCIAAVWLGHFAGSILQRS